jgi:hypothetical protein
LNKPLSIYLDLNKWIDLSRAYYQRADGKSYQQILEKLLVLVNSGKIILPLSAYHMIETKKTKDVARRKRLAEVMAILSKGITIAPQNRIAEREIFYSISTIFKKPVPSIPTAFGFGIPFAFGQTCELVEIASGKAIEIPEQFTNFYHQKN